MEGVQRVVRDLEINMFAPKSMEATSPKNPRTHVIMVFTSCVTVDFLVKNVT